MSNLEPTQKMIDAGIAQLWEDMPGSIDALHEEMSEEEVNDFLSDVVVFVWQAMKSKEENN